MAKWYSKGAPVTNPTKAEVVQALKDLHAWDAASMSALPGEILVRMLVGVAEAHGRTLEASGAPRPRSATAAQRAEMDRRQRLLRRSLTVDEIREVCGWPAPAH